MSQENASISPAAERLQGHDAVANYLRYFEYFNRQLFFEAHYVLEELWLPQRNSPEGAFYKGLIQLAGAFVHLQKKRLGPAAALLRLAQSNLDKYPARYQGLELLQVQQKISGWLVNIEQGLLRPDEPPKLDPPGEVA